LLTLALVANVRDKDAMALVESVFGEEPALQQETQYASVASALQQLPELAPEGIPLYMTMHGAGTPGQFMEFSALHPGRLIYAENYQFDTQGNYLGKAGFSDGETGKQVIYSVYRLHFGHFGGLPIKLLYGVLGLALSVVSATGINIWLERRTRSAWIKLEWQGYVLG